MATAMLTAALVVRMRASHPEFPLFGSRRNLGRLFVRGLAGASAMTLLYFSIKLLPLGDAVTLFFTNASVASLVSVLVGYEEPRWSIAAACALCTGGVILIAKPESIFVGTGAADISRLMGVLAGLTAAVASASAFICIRSLSGSEPALVVASWFHVTSVVLSAVPVAVGYPAPAAWPAGRDWPILGFLIMSSFSSQLFLSRGLALLSPSKASSIVLLEVVHARILSILFLHEQIEATGVGGSMLVAAGVLVAQLSNSDTNHTPDSVQALHPQRTGHS